MNPEEENASEKKWSICHWRTESFFWGGKCGLLNNHSKRLSLKSLILGLTIKRRIFPKHCHGESSELDIQNCGHGGNTKGFHHKLPSLFCFLKMDSFTDFKMTLAVNTLFQSLVVTSIATVSWKQGLNINTDGQGFLFSDNVWFRNFSLRLVSWQIE